MGSDEKHDTGWSIGYILLLVLVLVLLVTEPGRGLDQSYVTLFTGLLVAAIVGVIALMVATKLLEYDDDEYTPSVVSSSETRGLARHWAFKLAGAALLIGIFVGGSTATQQSLIPIIDPFDSSQLVTAENIGTISGTFLNATRSGLYPGVAEDTLGFVFVSILTLGLLWLWRKVVDDANGIMPVVIFSGLVSCIVWGVVFASAHWLAYGLKGSAYIGAFLYAFLSQLVNFLVGAPVSVFAHFGHNFWIIFTAGLAFSIGGIVATNPSIVGAAGAFLMSKTPFPAARRGQTQIALIIIAAVVVLAIAGTAYWYNANHGGNTLEIQGACTDFVNVEPATACTADSDCISALVPAGKELDPGMALRCTSGACQVQFGTCSGSVAP